MRPALLAVLLILHALAHAGAGMWAADESSRWVVVPLWLVAMCGFLAAAFGILGVQRLRRQVEYTTYASTAASAALLSLTGFWWLPAVGLGLGVLLSMAVQWWVRCSHPDIETRSICTGEVAAIREDSFTRQRVGDSLAYAFLVVTGLLILLRPLQRTWGTTEAERVAPLPGQSLATESTSRVDRGVTIRVGAGRVWPWLAQVGEDRAGFYANDWLQRAFSHHANHPDSLVRPWQARRVGDVVLAERADLLGGRREQGGAVGWRIDYWEPPHAMRLEGWGTFVVRAVDDSTSRLTIHSRSADRRSLAALTRSAIEFYLVEPARFIIERSMLLGIKARAERDSPPSSASPRER